MTPVAKTMPSGPLKSETTVVPPTATCYNCGRPGHYASSCRVKPQGNRPRFPHHTHAIQEMTEGEEEKNDRKSDDKSPTDEEHEDQKDPEEDEESYAGAGDQYDSDELHASSELEPYEERVGALCVETECYAEESCKAMTTFLGRDNRVEPYRAHHKLKDKTDVRPRIDLVKKQCLATHVLVNQSRAYTLFNMGSTTDMMSPDFSHVIRIPTFKLEQPVPIRLGCVGSRSAIHSRARATIQIGDLIKHNVYLDVANVDRYDLIL